MIAASATFEAKLGVWQVSQSSNGTLTQSPAFTNVPAGTNTSTYSEQGIQLLLQGQAIFPFNETSQAVLLTILDAAFDPILHILQFQSQGVRCLLA